MYTPVSILKYKVKDWPRYKLTKIRKGLPILEPPSQVFGLKTNLSAQPPKNKISLNPASLDNSHRLQLFTRFALCRCFYAGPTTVQRGAALETDWRTGSRFSCELAQRCAAPCRVCALVKVRVTGADNSTQIRIGLRAMASGKPSQTLYC